MPAAPAATAAPSKPVDTRTKIIAESALADALAGRPAQLVTGLFDLLYAPHVERLESLAQPDVLIVIAVEPDESAFLPLEARLEMAAALRMVDFCLPSSATLAAAWPWVAVHHDTGLHQRWRSGLVEHVRTRHQQQQQ